MDLLDVIGITAIVDNIKQRFAKKEQEYHPEEVAPVKFNYRPKNLDEYIGQDRAKELVKLNIEKIKTIKPVHFIISGVKGCGKSTLAFIIGNMLDFEMTWNIGGSFTIESLKDFLVKNQDKDKPQILFIDEIHNLSKEIAEYLYPVIEDFILPEKENIQLRPFIFMGATTEKNILMKKFSPLVDRCGADIVLEQYKPEDIKEILKQYNDKLYKLNIDEEIFDILSKNTRFSPRIALAYFDDLVVCKDIKKVLDIHRVVKDGLTTIDILILEHLGEINKPVGLEALAMIAGVTKEDYTYCIEPYLIMNSYISRTSRGRIITKKGNEILEEIK